MNRPHRLPVARALALSLLAASAAAGAQAKAPTDAKAKDLVELRALVGGVAALSAEEPEGVELSIGFDESVALFMPKDSPFVQGVEIEIKSPRAAVAVPGGFAYELWRRVEPEPDRKRVSYRGERLISRALPARAGFAIRIPVRAMHSIKPSPYSELLPLVVEARDFPLVFKLASVSKALTAEAEKAKFLVRARPLLGEEGALSLRFRYPEGTSERSPLYVTVDDRKVDPAAPILLKAGTYRLGVASDAYRDESRVVVVEQGRTLDLLVELQDGRPLLTVEAPDSAIVSLDGRRLDKAEREGIRIEGGEHSATCRIGDYTLTRRFIASAGKPYRLVLDIDLRVEEGQ
jgi:hypothetical protein